MFTGIVTDIGEVIVVGPRAEGLHRLKIACSYERTSIVTGASIACAGVCLTVVGVGIKEGRKLNLERALRVGDELGGHIVAGHVDGLATLVAREDATEMARLTLRAPAEFSRFIAAKGSVTLDGVALTVNEVDGDAFAVLVIPHTLQVTTLATLAVGDQVNLEVDLIARYAARLLAARGQ
jgi:riboflavin synthase